MFVLILAIFMRWLQVDQDEKECEMAQHVIRGTMVDTETLSLKSGALPWEIGAARFEIDFSGEVPHFTFGPQLRAIVNFDKLPTDGFHVNLKTIQWTNSMRKGDPAWECWFQRNMLGTDAPIPSGTELMTPSQIWRALDAIVGGSDPVFFRNSAFDPPILSHLMDQAGLGSELPWNRRRQSDVYSFVNHASSQHGYVDDLPKSTQHSALLDCMGQIAQLGEVMHLLAHGRPNPIIGSEDYNPVI